MKLDLQHKSIIYAYVERYPLPTTEEAAQTWTHRLCEQLAFSFPVDGWGHKSAGEGRPHSKDCIAIKAPFVGWDIIVSAGSPAATLNLSGDSIDLAGQLFEPVTPTNHLGDDPTPPDPPVPPSDLDARVAALEAAVRAAAKAFGTV